MIFMKIFKTRKQVELLRQDVAELSQMLKDHFGIKYDLKDFDEWYDRHPDIKRVKYVPVTEGEWFHYSDLLGPIFPHSEPLPKDVKLSFRAIPVLPKRKYTKE